MMDIDDGRSGVFGNMDNFSLNFTKAGFGGQITDLN
jgi:hypothetical protein